ncbi:Crotonobetainyl-CoA:carnitine CoA-transferase CaiB [Roseovarius azorensis]|uniref:Crotonobetainyl-CoA:carnitine CoA-transferase CaiB n=1 Tax=Roseovarius azorensis TaxID=1287727 RepID=A0A1H7XRR7_9RHOB|nr:CaiB/BaiF CoA-transferase family protein [Roseovarius azorensis]SEM36480.1 Crotonobetainyl-CoA:carnitine CoA-transferase CaiB [Roseovarius azorensis]
MGPCLPLEGVEVVCIEQAVAGPLASARLADAGAHVIKVERPEGDFARGYDDVAAGQSSYFVWLNRGKDSVTLDLASEDGKAALRALIGGADVLIQNLKLGSLERLGFDLGDLHTAYPRLITCSITGYGTQGPMAERKAYDLLVQAESGLCSITGGPSEPARVGMSIVDVATGSTAYAAILEALIARGRTGQGVRISVSMFDVMAEWLTVPLLNHEGCKTPTRVGLAHPSIAPYGAFQPKSGGPILMSVQSDREWRTLCARFIGAAELGTDDRFATNIARVRNRAETDRVVADAFARADHDDVIAALTAANIAFASVNDMAGLSAHPHLRRIEVETEGGTVALPAPAPIWDDAPRRYGPVPALKPLRD